MIWLNREKATQSLYFSLSLTLTQLPHFNSVSINNNNKCSAPFIQNTACIRTYPIECITFPTKTYSCLQRPKVKLMVALCLHDYWVCDLATYSIHTEYMSALCLSTEISKYCQGKQMFIQATFKDNDLLP